MYHDNQINDVDMEHSIVEALQRFAEYPRIRKAALMIVAHHQSQDQLADLRDAFLALDEDNSGFISLGELRELLERNGSHESREQIEELFHKLDQERTGEIRYMEFLAATVETRCILDEETLTTAFDGLDTDKTGFITHKNLKVMLGDHFKKRDFETFINEVDLAHDGRISRREFVTIMKDTFDKKMGTFMVDRKPLSTV